MKINKLITLILVAGSLMIPASALAATPAPNLPLNRNVIVNPSIITTTPTPTATPKTLLNPNLIKNIDLKALLFTNKRGELLNVKVTTVATTSITVDNNGTPVTVDIQTNTHFRRRFWGKSTLSEISVNDSVDVIGKWVNEDKTEIKAVLIRDLSIRKRQGVFFGTVKSFTDTGFVITTIHKGDEVVTIDSATKLVNRKQEEISISDIKVGHVVRIKGLWDSLKFTITDVTQIKDFTIPAVVAPTPTP